MAQPMVQSMSTEGSLPDAPAAVPTKQSYRSFKKKFAKLKVKFGLAMKESETLIREELRIEDLSKRIQEQNDQLLEVLLELNDSLYLSPNLRYHLSAPGDPDYVPPQARDRPQDRAQIERARIALEEARQSLSRGATSREAYRALEQRVRDANIFAPHTEYAILAQIQPPETQAKLDRPESEAACDTALGYFTPEHETEYYLALDAKLGDRAAELELDRAPEKPSFAERERDAAMRNPTSVYNWLRRNQPQIFLQDNEVASEKSASKPANVRTSKRPPVSARREEEMYDEDGIALDLGPAPKNKRKRDEDTGYRPKGGSSRPRKRKDDASKRAAKRSSGVGA